MSERRFVTCTLCEAMCGLVVQTDGAEVVSIGGDADDPFSRGHICPKAVALKDVHDDPDRLRTPVRREGSRWREIGWDEAFDAVARGVRSVQQAHGRDAVAVYLGNPMVHSLGAMLYAPAFVRSLGTRSRYSATSVDQLPHHFASHLMFGHQLLLPVPDLDRTDYLLVFGANPVASNGSLMTAPGVARRLKALRARGGRLVVVDPRRTETAEIADEHHFIRPGTDALVLLSMLHTLYAEGLVRPGRCAAFVSGLEAVGELSQRFPPERTERVTGVAAETIRRLARDFASAPRGVCYGRMGVSTQEFGGVSCWLVNVLNVVAGRLDEAGGAMFTRPAVDLVGGRFVGRGSVGRQRTRVRGLPAFGSELPSSALAEEIETPGAGQVRGLVTCAGNPVLSTPNGARLDRALAGLEFMAALDLYVNETTRHAHVILPPASPLERDHYDIVFHALAIRNTAKFSPAVFPRPTEARHDWEIFSDLTSRLQRTSLQGGASRADGHAHTLRRAIRARAATALQRHLGPRRLLDFALRAGPHGSGFRPFGKGLNLRRLNESAHGIDLGALEPCLPGRLATPDKHIQLAPSLLVADVARLEAVLAGPGVSQDDSLVLIGRRDLRSNNSWMHNSHRLVKGRARCTLLIHPDDARRRGLANGDLARVRSRVGVVDVEVEVDDGIAPGVVSLPHGWGHGRPGVRLSVAAAHAGVSVNDLTDDERVDVLTGNAAFSGVAVRVYRHVISPTDKTLLTSA